MTVHMLGGAPLPIHVRCVCLGRNEVVQEGFSVQGKAGCCRNACFSSAAVRKDACRDVGRWLQEPQPEDFPGTGNQGKVCCVGIPSSDSFFVTPVLPGPGSDIRMKMKTEKSGVWFFQNAGGSVGRVGTSVAHGRGGFGTEGIAPHSVGGSRWFLMFLCVCVRAGPAVLATASLCLEGCRTPDDALVC